METKGKVFEWRRVSGETLQIGDTRLTPQSHSLVVRMPYGGFVWNRPVGITVERGDRVEKYPIIDVTRLGLIFLAAAGFALALLAGTAGKRIARGKG